jgi:hypothetical protein
MRGKLLDIAMFMGLSRTSVLKYLIEMGHREIERKKKEGKVSGAPKSSGAPKITLH